MESPNEHTGELAIDLANTLERRRDGTTVDLLADRVGAGQLQALREHVLALLGAAVGRRPLPRAAVAAVNRAAAAAPAVVQLEADELVVRSNASPGDAFLADVAASAIGLVGGPRRDRLRRCGAPGCDRWFVASRPRQRWCSASCGNRARVARFQQRHRAA